MSAIQFTSHYLECDAAGCGETFVDTSIDQSVSEVRRAAWGHTWTTVGDRDFCWHHEPNELEDTE